MLEAGKAVYYDRENAYISNDVLDKMITVDDFTGREFRIISAVMLLGRCEGFMSLGDVAEATGMNKTHCSTLIKGLVDRKVLLRYKNGHSQQLLVNHETDEWKVNARKGFTQNEEE